MTNQTLPPSEGPEYTPCACSHIEPEHEPNAGECYSCDCAAYRPTPAVSLPPADQTALRDRIADALRTTRRAGYEGQADHGTHRYDARCALCAGDMDALTEALAAAVLPATTGQTADRAAVLREAASAACSGAVQFSTEAAQAAMKNGGPFALIAYAQLAISDHLRRMADETPAAETAHQPRRGDQFEAWLKRERDDYASDRANDHTVYDALNDLLDLYRLHADMGVPLGGHVCEAKVVGDCECLEQPAAEAQRAEAHAEGEHAFCGPECDTGHPAVGAWQDGAQPLPTPAETAPADESPHVYMDAVQDSAAWAHAFTKAGQMAEALEHVEAMERLLAVYRRAVGA